MTVSAVELLEACQARIEERNGGAPSFDGAPGAVNAWARLYPELALEAARAADERIAREGDAAPLLCGIPIGVKDLYGVAGLPLTASSRVLEGNVADEDALAWVRLRERGMVMVGHTHTHEFAAGGTTDQVGNPWDVSRSAGGSSGGSGAALAAGMVPVALGTDTAGSLRIPAALSGVSSIKPTHGRVPIDGIVPLSATLDHAGPDGAHRRRLRRGAERDGRGRRAGHAAHAPARAARRAAHRAARRRARRWPGCASRSPTGSQALAVEDDVMEGLQDARRACEELGASVVSLPGAGDPTMDDFSAVMFSEVAQHHARHAELIDRYRVSIREFVEVGANFAGAAVYIEAQQARERAVARLGGVVRRARRGRGARADRADDRAAARTRLRLRPPRRRGRPPDRLHRRLELRGLPGRGAARRAGLALRACPWACRSWHRAGARSSSPRWRSTSRPARCRRSGSRPPSYRAGDQVADALDDLVRPAGLRQLREVDAAADPAAHEHRVRAADVPERHLERDVVADHRDLARRHPQVRRRSRRPPPATACRRSRGRRPVAFWSAAVTIEPLLKIRPFAPEYAGT